jgi:hypothetical protein
VAPNYPQSKGSQTVAYQVKIVSGDTTTTVHATPDSFAVNGDDDGTTVSIGWCRNDLLADPAGYTAVVSAWPGEDHATLTVYDSDDEPVFDGVVTGVAYDSKHVNIDAFEASTAQPLTINVVVDATDPTSVTASITANNYGQGPVAFDYGDDSPNEDNPGDGTTANVHAYEPGMYTVVATDTDNPVRTAAKVVTIPFPNPDLDLTITVTAEPSDPSRHVGIVKANNHGQGQVVVSFGDATPVAVNVGDGVAGSVHAWVNPGVYTVTVTDVDQPWRTVSQDVTIPFPL